MNSYKIKMLNKFLNFVKSYYENKDPAHDFKHIQRIARKSELLLEDEKTVDETLLSFLIAFHGLVKLLQQDSNFKLKTQQFLKELDFQNDEIYGMFISLERHLIEPEIFEEKIVHDANYLELVGAFGVAKAFTTGGARGQGYKETADIFEYQYLDKIEFKTEKGRELATEERKYTKDFFRRFREELLECE